MEIVKTKESLNVYLQGELVGKLISENATLSFKYVEKYIASSRAKKISASLPLQEGIFDHQVTSAFFSGLLPDEGVRVRLANYLRISEKNTFALLKEIGGECAGAISLYPEDVIPSDINIPTYRILEEDEADKILHELDKRPMFVGEEVRISGAGAQDKLILAFVGKNIAIPTGNTPSTHILKPQIKDLADTVHNEYFCMKLAHEMGLPVPNVEIFFLTNRPYYLVARYDRCISDNGFVTRIHQEDFCQAMHIAPEIKYENEGGPSILQCFNLLDGRIRSGSMAGNNKIILLQGIIFNYLIGNGDAHGKNFSILYEGEGEVLAPFYDLLCTAVYSNHFKAKMAMKLGGTYKFKEVSLRNFVKLGLELDFRSDFVKKQVFHSAELVVKKAIALKGVLSARSELNSPVYDQIINVIETNAKQVLVSGD